MNHDLFAPLGAISAITPLASAGALPPGLPTAGTAGIPGITGITGITGAPAVAGSAGLAAPVNDFGNWFQSQLNTVNGKLLQVDHEMQTVALGGTQNLHQFMIHMEEAKHSFQLLVQVRNRVLESYQEVMRMQV